MDYKAELQNIMDGCINSIKDRRDISSSYLIGLVQMKAIVVNYLKDKDITLQDK